MNIVYYFLSWIYLYHEHERVTHHSNLLILARIICNKTEEKSP